MRELETLGLIPTGRGAWHGHTVTDTPVGSSGRTVRTVWQVSAIIDTDQPNPLRRYGVLVRMADDLGDYRAKYVACLADLPTLAAAALRDPYAVTGSKVAV